MKKMRTFDFGHALELLRTDKRVARVKWTEKNTWIRLQVPDEHSKMKKPYIYMSPVDGENVPWVASQSDMLATDWVDYDDPDQTNMKHYDLDFGAAISLARNGYKLVRRGWSFCKFVTLQERNAERCIRNGDYFRVYWGDPKCHKECEAYVPTQDDMLADDWFVVREGN